jgi:SAM-dependent methyltransferase
MCTVNDSTDKLFAGYIPKLYETYMVPMLFEPYAQDIARRLAPRTLANVLEVAAGTGVVTRALASTLPQHVAIVATDLNQPMLDHAATLGTARPVEWRQADAMALPFDDESFDAVVCQFGVMFLPDKAKAFAEMRRVLRRGGILVFNTWDRIEKNEFADTITNALETLFPNDPPRFMARVPHGYHDRAAIAHDLVGGGFRARPEVFTVPKRSRAESPRHAAIAICQGTPVRNEIEARDASRLEEATDVAAAAIARRFGRGAVDGKMQAHIVTVHR